jgi:hypothetical protein
MGKNYDMMLNADTKTKTKVKKGLFITFTVIAVLFIGFGLFAYFSNQIIDPSPVAITERLEIKKKDDGTYYWVGKLKNISKEPVVISSIRVNIRTADKYQSSYGDLRDNFFDWDEEAVTLQPNEEFDLNGRVWTGGVRIPDKITEVNVVVQENPVNHAFMLYPKVPPTQMTVFIFSCSIGAVFLIIGVVLLLFGQKRARKIDAIKAKLADGELFVPGMILSAGANKAAISKTILSALGGIIGLVFLGFGFYKTYSGAVKQDLIIRDDGILIHKTNKLIANADIKKPVIAVSKRCITLSYSTNEGEPPTVIYFNAKSAALDPKTITDRLNDLVAAAKAGVPVSPT